MMFARSRDENRSDSLVGGLLGIRAGITKSWLVVLELNSRFLPVVHEDHFHVLSSISGDCVNPLAKNESFKPIDCIVRPSSFTVML